ncbi:hypothetical protein ZEAMMB73_Zm00001d020191 [Zea mays]|uniref:Uncharacterized protein n=1 Tax=Zea mays TaxID=4577 RepID=A0A1D6I2Q9_MAIZE|nr:hypothetical protein ZEAMMB73_Zm00001d020191 [Zea mays]
MIEYISPRPRVELDQAATTLQKAYKFLKLLTRATATATTCTSTTTSGARAPAASPSSTGWMLAKAETCIARNAHEASSTHSSSCTSDQTRGQRHGGRPGAVQAERRSGEHERGVQVDLRAEHQQVADGAVAPMELDGVIRLDWV